MTHFIASSMPEEGLGALLLFQLVERATPDFFAPDRVIHVSRAPGRLEVLSGHGEGSRALHLPTSEAVCAALQLRDDELIRIWSPGGEGRRTERLSVRLPDLGIPGEAISYEEARAFLCADPRDAWSAHVLGTVLVLAHEHGFAPKAGFDLLLYSDIPEEAGAGSSAAVEVATLQAVVAAYEIDLSLRELARLAHIAEREILGVDRGGIDQITAALSEAGRLLLHGAENAAEGDVAIPENLEFVALDTGAGPGVMRSDDPEVGRDESGRTSRFAELMREPLSDETRRELGELMFASHAARAAAGQRHRAVDFLMEKARERMAAGAGLIGASAVGRGVVVLLGEPTKVWHEALRMKKALRDDMGHSAHVFRWSSPGAEAFGTVQLRPAGD